MKMVEEVMSTLKHDVARWKSAKIDSSSGTRFKCHLTSRDESGPWGVHGAYDGERRDE